MSFAWLQQSADTASRSGQVRDELRSAPRDLATAFESLVDGFFRHLPGAIVGLVVLAVFWVLSKIAVRLVERLMKRAGTAEELRELLLPLLRFFVLSFGLLAALDQMGFEVQSLIAGLGIAGLAVGLAAQETIANLLAGFSILWDRPFRLGDTVTMAGSTGEVTEIGLRSTRLKTLEMREVILPNKEVVRGAIVNHTRFPESRVTVALTVAHEVSLARLDEVLVAAARRDLPLVQSPATHVFVTAIGSEGVTVELRVFVARADLATVTTSRLLEMARRALLEAGIDPTPAPRPIRIAGAVGQPGGSAG